MKNKSLFPGTATHTGIAAQVGVTILSLSSPGTVYPSSMKGASLIFSGAHDYKMTFGYGGVLAIDPKAALIFADTPDYMLFRDGDVRALAKVQPIGKVRPIGKVQSIGSVKGIDPKPDLRLEFKRLSEKLWEETEVVSSLSEIYANPNYLRVIALGKKVIPFILEELKAEPKPWFLALRELTERDDIGTTTPGRFRDIADAWIKWGIENGYTQKA